MTKSYIAKALGVCKSTICREIKRNSNRHGVYNPKFAHLLASERRERIAKNRKFTKSVENLVRKMIIEDQWSPQQIVGYCKKHAIPMVSHERIYAFIRLDKLRGGTLHKYLRHKLKYRRHHLTGKQVGIKDRVLIDLRSEVINRKERFGDWEIDLIIGKDGHGAIVTIVERTTAFLLMRKLPLGKNAKALTKTVIDMLLPYKKYVLSITSDNGMEFADFKAISAKLGCEFFFTHPYCSWEKGLIEYTNKLVRQYIPKKAVFSHFDDMEVAEIQRKLNRRPRFNLKFSSPKQMFFSMVDGGFATKKNTEGVKKGK